MDFSDFWVIYNVVHGSRAYGTHLPGSDRDEKGVCIPPKNILMSPFQNFEQRETKDPDSVVYSLDKFIKLAAACNPNIIETLFVSDKHILKMTPAGSVLREYRYSFLSKLAAKTFTGYAASQLRRLRNHKKWNDEAPEHPGQGQPAMSKKQVLGIDDYCAMGNREFPTYEDLEKVKAQMGQKKATDWFHSKTYYLKVKEYNRYKTWEESRNTSRAALEKKYGYDTKHAYHCVRLLRMGVEILRDEVVNVDRTDIDAEDLLDIRKGVRSYADLMVEAERLKEEISEAEQATNLPDEPDYETLTNLYINLVELQESVQGTSV